MTVSGLTGENISVQTSPDGYWGAPASPSFYRTDWQGTQQLYSTARTNQQIFSDFGNASWTKAGTTCTANAGIAPDGTNTAALLTEDSTTGTHIIYRSTGTNVANQGYGISFYAKANGRTKISLVVAGFGQLNPGVVFDLSTGRVTSNIGKMYPMANGWWRCYAAGYSTAITAQNIQVRLVTDYTTESYAGDGASGVYLWGNQDEPNTFNNYAYAISCEGDSITQQAQSGPWPALLGVAAPSTYSNAAVSGSKTADMVTRYDTYKTNSRTHFAVLGGTNDVLQDVATATTQANLSYMWSDAKSRGAIVIVMTIPPCQGYAALWTPARQANLEYINNWIRGQATANGYVLVDVYTVLGQQGNQSYLNPAFDSGDGLHPNIAGGHAIRDAVADAIMVPTTSPTPFITTNGTAVTITDYTISNGVITVSPAPPSGIPLSYDNGVIPSPYYIFATGNGTRTTFAYDGVWGTLTANSGKGNGIWQVDLRGAQAYRLVKSAGSETATVNMTLKRDALQYTNSAGTWSVT